MYYESNYLSHHGVKGMKWGVRHDPERKGIGRKSSADPKKKKQYMKAKDVQWKGNYGKAQQYAQKGLTTYAVGLGAAIVSSAVVKTLAYKGKINAAVTVSKCAKVPVSALKTVAGVDALLAGHYLATDVDILDKYKKTKFSERATNVYLNRKSF